MKDDKMSTFLALCDTMNYRLAAEHLHITQPAVTQHIHALEQYYGCRLFQYDGRHLFKTAEAGTLERYARAMAYQERELLSALHPAPENHLSIGATKTIGEFVIGGQVARYLKDAHNHISVQVGNTQEMLQLLDRGKIDFALVEGNFDRSLYDCSLYRRESFRGLCGSHHPFAERTVLPEEIFAETLLIREVGSGTRDVLEQVLTAANHSTAEFTRVATINNFGLLCSLLSENAGISFSYDAVARGNRQLAQFQVTGWDIAREFNYVYLRHTDARQAVALFESYR
ncbi:MAG: LysR family transcriptional regulator [Clostridiales bacterium]|nr:LysR family transcriptional regulator [Clostridiales bacterium]